MLQTDAALGACAGWAWGAAQLRAGAPAPRTGLSDAPLSSGECEGLISGLFVAPHSSDDAVGELAFVGSSGFASGLAFGGFFGEVGNRLGLAALLGDRRDVQHAVDAPVASEVEPVLDGVGGAFA